MRPFYIYTHPPYPPNPTLLLKCPEMEFIKVNWVKPTLEFWQLAIQSGGFSSDLDFQIPLASGFLFQR